MEFNFNINNYFKEEITKIGSRLVPDGFIGDRREIQDCLSKVSYILNVLGEKSAKAQGLQKAITSGEKLRNSDHVIYVLADPKGGSKGFGTVLGMLKMGVKHLYVFDAGGNTHEVTTKCILDFYVHESKQRMGLGKKLFQYMLKEEKVDPVHLAIDKPSSKFLSFLLKHYGLQTIIPQMNNFVLFDGFFTNRPYGEEPNGKRKECMVGNNSCGSRLTSGTEELQASSRSPVHYQSVSAINLNTMPYYGRPAPHKPVSTMGMILQQKPAPSQQPQQNGSFSQPAFENSCQVDSKQRNCDETYPIENDANECYDNGKEENNSVVEEDNATNGSATENNETQKEIEKEPSLALSEESDKQIANNNMEINAQSQNRKEHRLNSQGYLDLKFFHSSLW